MTVTISSISIKRAPFSYFERVCLFSVNRYYILQGSQHIELESLGLLISCIENGQESGGGGVRRLTVTIQRYFKQIMKGLTSSEYLLHTSVLSAWH